MTDSDRPQSPFAGMANLSTKRPVRVLFPDEIEQMLALHRLYLETEYHEGHRANFSSADLTRRDFSGLNLRGIKMDRALLRGTDFTAADLRGANLIGAMLQEARFDRADLSRARSTATTRPTIFRTCMWLDPASSTCGASNPTYTIFALSLRGAEQLAENWATVAG